MKTQAKRTFPYVTVALIAVAVLVLFMVVYTLLGNFGVFGRMHTVAQTSNYSLNQNEVRVFEYQAGQNSLYQEWMYYYYYGTSMGLTEVEATAFQATYSSPQIYINYAMPTNVSMGAYDGTATTAAGNYLIYCELADASGFSATIPDEQVDAEVDAYMNLLKQNAESVGLTLGSYISKYIGNGVSKGDIRNALRIQYLAGEYMEAREDEIAENLTDEQLEKYRDDNKGSFFSTKYTSYKFMDKAMHDALKDNDIQTVEDMQNAIAEYLVDLKFDDLYKTNVLDKADKKDDASSTKAAESESESESESETEAEAKDPDAGLTDEQKAAKAECKKKVLETIKALNKIDEESKEQYTSSDTNEYAIVSAINTTVSAQLKLISDTGSSAYQDLSKEETLKAATELNKWLFDTKNPAKTDEVKIITQETTSTDSTGKETKTTTYTWYRVGKTMVLDEEKTMEAYYVLLKDDASTVENGKTAKEKAEAMLESLKANLAKDDAELMAQLRDNETYKAQWDAGTVTEKSLLEAVTPGNFDLLAAEAAGASAGTSYYFEAITDARDEDTPAATDALYAYLFSDKATEGSYDMVASTEEKDGKTTTVGYYVVYVVDQNEETWKRTARSSKATATLEAELEAAKTTYALELDTEAESTAADA